MNLLKRTLIVLKTEGPRGVIQRIVRRGRSHFSRIHLLVFASDPDWIPEIVTPALPQVQQDHRAQNTQPVLEPPLEFKRIDAGDEQEIDVLTEIDPWKIPKAFTLEKLREGWLCFVAKLDNRIVASGWIVINRSFKDDFLNRDFDLGAAEAFFWRCFCLPDIRGRGIMPRLLMHVSEQCRREHLKTHLIMTVRASNTAMHRAIGKIGWRVAGRLGFFETFGVRFHYLWGREAFNKTKKRSFVRINRKP